MSIIGRLVVDRYFFILVVFQIAKNSLYGNTSRWTNKRTRERTNRCAHPIACLFLLLDMLTYFVMSSIFFNNADKKTIAVIIYLLQPPMICCCCDDQCHNDNSLSNKDKLLWQYYNYHYTFFLPVRSILEYLLTTGNLWWRMCHQNENVMLYSAWYD